MDYMNSANDDSRTSTETPSEHTNSTAPAKTEHQAHNLEAGKTEHDMTDITTPSAPTPSNAPSLPPVDQLFRQSWDTMLKGALNALWISLLSFLFSGIALALVVGTFIGVVATSVNLSELTEEFKALGPAALFSLAPNAVVGLTVSIGLAVILFTVIGAMYTGASILAFAWADQKPSVGALLKGGFRYSGWFILYSFLVGLLTFGGLWFFIIPSLLISIFMSFGVYELFLAGKKPIAAMKSSVSVIAENFGAIIGRVLLFMLGYMVITILLPSIFSAMGEEAAVAYSFLNMLISLPLSWFSIAFSVTLYKQAKAATPATASHSGLFWTLVSLSILGWIGFIILGSFLIRIGSTMMQERFAKDQSVKSEMNTDYSMDTLETMKNYESEINTMQEDGELSQDEIDSIINEAMKAQVQPSTPPRVQGL